MRIKWRDFELPSRVICDEKTLSATYGRFIAEPFEQGFGVTIANGLRRVLLSSIEGAAVTTVRIKDVPHQFTNIEGVLEDILEITLNIKRLIVRLNSDESKTLILNVKKKGEVKAFDITPDSTVEIINPELHLLTLLEEKEFYAELTVKKGRGYVLAENKPNEEQEIGLIHLDALFSPILKVDYRVDNTRLGRLTNYDRLILEIWTNGTVTPEMALVEASKTYRKHLNPFTQYFETGRELQIDEKKEEEQRDKETYLIELKRKLSLPLTELDLSVRSSNCLRVEKIRTIGDLVIHNEAHLVKIRNFGKTSLREVKKKLSEHALSLGMDLKAVFEQQAP